MLLLIESEAGSDPASMKTSFKKTKDGYILNGSKNWITNAPIADIFIIWAIEENKDHKSIKGFIIEKKNVVIGNNCVFAGCLGVAGSATIGNYVFTGGQIPKISRYFWELPKVTVA